MCTNYALDLATSVINLEFNKNKVLTRDKKNKRLCHCRKVILENYISVAQMLYIRITARTIKFLEDKANSNITLDLDDLKAWFFERSYDEMFIDPTISNKMVILFRELQSLMDRKFFDFFAEKYKDIIRIKINNEINDEAFGVLLNDLYQSMLKWFETSIFNAMTLKIDCNSIKNEIFSDMNVPEDNFCCYTFSKCDNCAKCGDMKCDRNGCTHHVKEGEMEDIHLYIIDEMLETEHWIESYFELVNKYHKNPKNINLVFDFKLYDDKYRLEMDEKLYTLILLGEELFNNVTVVNYQGVNMNSWEPQLERYFAV